MGTQVSGRTRSPGEPAAAEDFECEVSSVADRVRSLRADGLTPKQIRVALPEATPWAVNCAINRDATAIAAPPGRRARAKDEDRERARALRLEGMTYRQILQQVAVSKGTLSMWLRDLPSPQPNRAPHTAHMHRVRAERIRIDRARVKAAASAEIGGLSERELFVLGVGLYWAEGAKDKPASAQRWESVRFVNSDPSMIRVFLAWLDLLGVPPRQRRFRVAIHESAVVAEAEEFWRVVTAAPADLFHRSTVKRHNPKTVRRKTGGDYHGCLTVQVLGGGDLYRRIEGWWRGIAVATGGGGRA